MTNRAALYFRVSSAKQAGEDRASLPVQHAACAAYAAQHGWDVVATAEDHESGKNVTRAGYQGLLELARAGSVDHIVVYSPERFGRKAWEVLARREEMDELGVDLHAVTKDLKDWLSHAINAVIGENELKVMQSRVAPAKRRRAEQGYWLSNPPWGTVCEKGILKPGRHFDLVEAIFKLCIEGLPVREIARRINYELDRRYEHDVARGRVVAPETYDQHGRKHYTIDVSTVRKTILNPAFEGKVKWLDVDAPGLWPAMVDALTIARARAALHRRYVQRAPLSPAYPYWIVGLAVCGVCGAKLHPKVDKKSWGTVYAYLICGRQDRRVLKRACGGVHFNLLELQDWFVRQVGSLRLNAGPVLEHLAGFQLARDAEITERRAGIEGEIARLEARIARAENLMLEGHITGQRFTQLRRGAELTIADHRAALQALNASAGDHQDYEALRRLLEDVDLLAMRDTNPAAFRELLQRFVAAVIVKGKGDYEITWTPAMAKTHVEIR